MKNSQIFHNKVDICLFVFLFFYILYFWEFMESIKSVASCDHFEREPFHSPVAIASNMNPLPQQSQVLGFIMIIFLSLFYKEIYAKSGESGIEADEEYEQQHIRVLAMEVTQ